MGGFFVPMPATCWRRSARRVRPARDARLGG
jgi:hypothetical protein